jgi:hypothetical protein
MYVCSVIPSSVLCLSEPTGLCKKDQRHTEYHCHSILFKPPLPVSAYHHLWPASPPRQNRLLAGCDFVRPENKQRHQYWADKAQGRAVTGSRLSDPTDHSMTVMVSRQQHSQVLLIPLKTVTTSHCLTPGHPHLIHFTRCVPSQGTLLDLIRLNSFSDILICRRPLVM